MVVGPRLAVSLNHLGSHKYWIRESRTDTELNVLSMRRGFWGVRLPKSQQRSNRDLPMLRASRRRRRAPLVAAAASSPEIVPAKFDEENPSTPISSGLLVQADEGVSHPVVDLIDDIYRRLP
ncbi:phosphoenolpyruvate carboxylase 2-like [Dorcoceras hygrometricum]|uniref:Phosphoenolpyruvate carboxylase 2-like n=1 Tax=Dorcoceras hygrometricum TaxID=472368 RepID=A0A2Z6ZZ23_9LAMI|nr:phosphoenolpyruvate carboxylase 2-like [Dorcoceras hygrometricum]